MSSQTRTEWFLLLPSGTTDGSGLTLLVVNCTRRPALSLVVLVNHCGFLLHFYPLFRFLVVCRRKTRTEPRIPLHTQVPTEGGVPEGREPCLKVCYSSVPYPKKTSDPVVG